MSISRFADAERCRRAATFHTVRVEIVMPGNFDRIVRCRQGHLFETIWVPFASIKAVRLGPWRFQRCPVGNHMSLIRRVDASSLTPDELAEARSHRDTRVP